MTQRLVNISTSYTQLNVSTVTGTIVFQNIGGAPMLVKRSTSAPSDDSGAFLYEPGYGERGDIDDLFPTLGDYLWARSARGTLATVDHL